MRTTLRIDDDLLQVLKKLARKNGARLTELVNTFLRRGLNASREKRLESSKAYREQVFSMGTPALNLDKALALSAALEDEEVLEKLARRK